MSNWCECRLTPSDRLYHDTQWGIPQHDDRALFEALMLEALQCGLSWSIVYGKVSVFRRAFAAFDYEKVARFTDADTERIMQLDGMIRSERKIRAVISNACCFIKIREECGSFSEYLWKYTEHRTILYSNHENGAVPVSNALSDNIAHDLKKRGFKFLGTVTVYAFLQAVGVINDHSCSCPRYRYIIKNFSCRKMRDDGEKF